MLDLAENLLLCVDRSLLERMPVVLTSAHRKAVVHRLWERMQGSGKAVSVWIFHEHLHMMFHYVFQRASWHRKTSMRFKYPMADL